MYTNKGGDCHSYTVVYEFHLILEYNHDIKIYINIHLKLLNIIFKRLSKSNHLLLFFYS